MAKKRQTRSRTGGGSGGGGGRRRGSGTGQGSGGQQGGYQGGQQGGQTGGPRGRGRSGGGGGGGGRRRAGPPSSNVPRNNLDQEEFDPSEPIPLEPGYGLLEMHPNGYGFLRSPENNYARERTDPFVPGTMIERYNLREGVLVRGMIQRFRRGQGPRLRDITDVDGMCPDDYMQVKTFDELTPVNPSEHLKLEINGGPLSNRVVDLLTPLGKGQRALIVAPPRTGKTMLLQNISKGVSTNHPELTLMVLLIDERPEEVTDMQRSINGEVIASSLDRDVESHVRLSQLVIERCKRLAEMGQDVFLLMDSITRLARAFNKWVGDSRGGGNSAIMSGGINVKALDIPKKLFATARSFEEGGSLTIVATALIDTGSKMDEVIFQEFKGTGNMELVLDRKLADRRVWPAIDISQSGTRREELLLDEETLNAVVALRRTLSSMHHCDAMEQLTRQLAKYDNNDQFVSLIASTRERY
ncbi:MAG: transcription termination factor Rho [Pirellulaceae bacterium]